MLGGVNVSKLYNGNTSQNMSGYNFTWYDSGMLLKDEHKRIYKFIHNLFHTINYDSTRENVIINKQIQLISNNYDAYTELVNAIRQSKQNIYIENQYLASHKKHTTNKIAYEIAMRINRAINENKLFRVVLIINYRNYDETNVVQFCMTNTWLGTLYYIRSLVNCDDNMFNKYINILTPRDDLNIRLIIHTKIYIIDDIFCLYTTGNCLDRCFMDNAGEYELSIITRNRDEVCNLYRQSINYFNKNTDKFMCINNIINTPINIGKMICYIPNMLEFTIIRDNYSNKTYNSDTNQSLLFDTFIEYCINPLYMLIDNSTFQEITGARKQLVG